VVAGAVNSSASISSISSTARFAPAANVGTYYPVTPARILDTRDGTGAPARPIGSNGLLSLQVGGRGAVPDAGVSAVVLNVTATDVTGSSFVTVFPSGVAMPTASSLNTTPGATIANSVTVGLGADGKVNLYNNAGNVNLIGDVVGFYAADDSLVETRGVGGGYSPVIPGRLFDSRSDLGHKVGAGGTVQVGVTFNEPGQPDVDSHIRALVVNVTATEADGAGFLTTWDGSVARPLASTLNYTRGATVPNMAVVPTSICVPCGGFPSIGVFTSVQSHFIVDILGIFDDGTLGGLRFSPMTPTRIADSRAGFGLPGPIGPARTATITAPERVVTADVFGLALNVTAIQPTGNTFVTVWPQMAGVNMPASSNLNPSAGQIVPNAVYTLIGPTFAFNVYNNAGTTGLVVDVVGTFYQDEGGTSLRAPSRTQPLRASSTRHVAVKE
jgi:hypothetical protein